MFFFFWSFIIFLFHLLKDYSFKVFKKITPFISKIMIFKFLFLYIKKLFSVVYLIHFYFQYQLI